jgi:hypothetical protein
MSDGDFKIGDSEMFLDPRRPLATCVAETCGDCPVRKEIHCHFRGKDLSHFLIVMFPAFLVGGAGIVQVNGWLLLPWLAICLGYFGLVEIRVMCSHCPHYAEAGGTLKCWANYGSPKLWQYRPGPMTSGEKIVFFGGLVAVLGYPAIWLVAGQSWFLLVLYALTSYGFYLTMQSGMCSRCMNFACPLNRVGQDTRDKFFARNPRVAEAWSGKAG